MPARVRLKEKADPFGLADVITAAERVRMTVYNVVQGVRLFGLPPDAQVERAKAALRNQLTAAPAEARGRAQEQMKGGVPARGLIGTSKDFSGNRPL